jgi:hypothetical protein
MTVYDNKKYERKKIGKKKKKKKRIYTSKYFSTFFREI